MTLGLISTVQFTILAILVVTGWMDTAIHKLAVSRSMITSWTILLFLLNHLNIPIQNMWVFNAGFCFTAFIVVYLWCKFDMSALCASTTIFGAALCFVLHELSMIDPVLVVLPTYLVQCIVLFLLSTLLQAPWQRLTFFIGATFLNSILVTVFHFNEFVQPAFGEPAFFELLSACMLIFFVSENISLSINSKVHSNLKTIKKEVS